MKLLQGLDYIYTLQGWLRGVNSTTVSDGSFDIGKDGLSTSINNKVARDGIGFGLHYYDAVSGSDTWLDYKTIASTSAFARPGAGSNFVSLYNGNIGAMSVNNAGLLKGPAATTNALPLFYNYRYDQLNRIVSMQVYKGLRVNTNAWDSSFIAINDYKEAITYDPNGNILTYNRKGSPSIAGKQPEMDNLTYNYIANTNKLNFVADPTPVANYTEDIDAQTTGNYVYDKIGNLIKDLKDTIGTATTQGIFWNVYGKITSIIKNGNTISYTYDAAGNRISKTANGRTTVYVRDASGNVMSVYEKDSNPVRQTETHLFGSGRLGIAMGRPVVLPSVNLASGFGMATIDTFARGEKVFELSNHLGNVLATVSDKKIGHDAGNGTIDYYNADVVSATDYFPFGLNMPGRTYGVTGRYGFNGKERDKDMNSLTAYDYGFRIYNPAIGRFLSIDPLTQEYAELTPYQFASNTPIQAIDLDGLESQRAIDGSTVYGPVYMPKINEEIVKKKVTNQQDLALLKNATTASAGAIGARAAQAGVVRLDYAFKNYSLKPTYENGSFAEKIEASKTRNSNVLKARKYTPEPYLSFAEDLKSGKDLPIKPEGRFYKTNPKVNVTMGVVGTAGTLLTGYAVYNSYQNIKNSDDKATAIVEEGASWGGALYGGSVGAGLGAPAGPWGVAAGSLVGSVVGGIGGRGAVEALKNAVGNEADSSGPWMFNGRAAPDNTVVNTPVIDKVP